MTNPSKSVGRYEIHGAIGRGGMATIRLGRLRGDAGFSRVVAVKHLHEHVASDPDFAAMLRDEARLASRIRHPNVVGILDVVTDAGQVYLILEYVYGESLAALLREGRTNRKPAPPAVAVSIACDMLAGLHAAHAAVDIDGTPLGIVHRDVSPNNVIVGADGVARILDFGVAKAVAKLHTTRAGTLKGTLPYMAPENLRGEDATVRSDIHAVGCVLWEALTGERLFQGENEAVILGRVLEGVRRPPSSAGADVPTTVDEVVLRALQRDPADRFDTAADMGRALKEAFPPARPEEVGAWVEGLLGASLAIRRDQVRRVERGEQWQEGGVPLGQVATRTALPAQPADATHTTTAALSSPHRRAAGHRLPRAWWAVVPVALGGLAAYAALDVDAPVVAESGAFGRAVSSYELPVSSAAPSASPVATAAAAVASEPPSDPPEPKAKAPPVKPRPRPPAVVAPNCDPPIAPDAHGILRVKPGCDPTGRH